MIVQIILTCPWVFFSLFPCIVIQKTIGISALRFASFIHLVQFNIPKLVILGRNNWAIIEGGKQVSFSSFNRRIATSVQNHTNFQHTTKASAKLRTKMRGSKWMGKLPRGNTKNGSVLAKVTDPLSRNMQLRIYHSWT